jgi:hypothetical protein
LPVRLCTHSLLSGCLCWWFSFRWPFMLFLCHCSVAALVSAAAIP